MMMFTQVYGVMVKALVFYSTRSRVWLPAIPLLGSNLGQVVHTRASVTKQCNLVPVTWHWCPVTWKVTVGQASHW